MIRCLIISVLLLVATVALSQVNNTDLDSLLTQYNKSKVDTNRVIILLQLDTLYAYQKGSKNGILDSATLLARQAKELSHYLRFTRGYEEATYMLALSYLRKKDLPSALTVMNETKGGVRVHILIRIGEFYAFRPGQSPRDLDSAYPYISGAINLSNAIKSTYWLHESLCMLGKYYYERGEFEKGRDCFMQVIRDYQHDGNKEKEAFWWEELGIYMPDTDSTFPFEVSAYQNARTLFHQLGNIGEEKSVIGNLAYIYQRHGKLDSSENLYLQEIALGKKLGRKSFSITYTNLAELNLSKGDYNNSVYYSMEAIKYLDSSKNYDAAGITFFTLAEAYRELGETDKSLQWYRASLNNLEKGNAEYLFSIARRISGALITKNRAGEALSFLQDFIKRNNAARYADKEIFAAALGDCYTALKLNNTAEKYYLQMILFDSLANKQLIKEIFSDTHGAMLNSADAHFIIGKFYVENGKYKLAGTHLNKALAKSYFEPTLIQLRDIHFLLFKVDSAKGNYTNAIREYQTGKSLNDSVFNIAKNKQIQELQVKYDVEQNQRKLQVLQTKELLQNKALQGAQQARYFTYALVLILLASIGIVYSRYRIKQKSNKQLEAKQEEINQKNVMLENLVQDKDELINEKDTLLEEKEWLLKEVHHRVKNNLQIVISLLNTQSKYLDSEEAIKAFTESRHRMQAMSLIHQKLYLSQNTGTVNMPTYIGELTDYLKASFNSNKYIHFDIEVEDIELDIAQAIPIGLVLNEAITNAIKYAFSGVGNSVISITMKKSNDNHILLKIQDNGKGFHAPVEAADYDTMGIRLMKGLVKQIEGNLTIQSKQGVCISVEFTTDDILKSITNNASEKSTVAA